MTLLRPAGVPALLSAASLLMLPAAARAAEVGKPVDVAISDKGCDPASVTVEPGKSVFKIRNVSQRAVEWEILKGVDVVEERENIIPGFTQTLSATLDAGDYQMTCGLLSNPKGVLTVAAAAGSGPAAKPGPLSPMDLVGPLAAYKAYVTKEVDTLVDETKTLTEAVKSGRIDDAKALYAPARQHYERIEPIAELFNDLDGSMDSRADDFEKKEADPAFLGFHRIELGLYRDGSTAGLAPVADKLMADALDLQKRLADLAIPPKSMVGGAADLIEEVASKKITGEEDRYSRTDLWDFQANVDGAQKIVALLDPLVARRDATLVARLKDNFAKVDAVLAKYRAPEGGFVSYDKLASDDRTRLKGPVTALAEDLSTLRGTLGID